MDNNNKQDPNMKSNWQTITMLVVAAILTFIVVSSMNNYLNSKKRQELSYNEFVQMVEAGEVDSIKVGSTEITVIPKKGNTKYYRGAEVEVNLLPKIKVEVVVCAVPVSAVIDAAKKALYTGNIGDGKIFVYGIDEVVKVRTGETNAAALQGVDQF